jgi:hypothetical protein
MTPTEETTQPAPAPAKPRRRRKHHKRRKYSSKPIVPFRPDEASLGPAMRELSPLRRQFVLELRYGPSGYGSAIRAARASGLVGKKTTDEAARVTTSRVLHDPKVQAALREVGGAWVTAEAFTAIGNVATIANDQEHRDCLRANLALMDRGGFAVETTHHVTVEHKIDYTKQALEEIARFRALGVARERLEAIYGSDGVYHLEQQLERDKVIEGEAVEVAP